MVDPLVPDDEPERFWDALDRDVERRALPLAVLLTQAAHARDAGEVARRYGAVVWGDERARAKAGGADFRAISSGDSVPGGRALPFDQEPGGSGTPLYLDSHRALAVGDVFISVDGALRIWWEHGASKEQWLREHLLPSLRRWLELPVDHLLISHGGPLPPDELARALERPPHAIV